MSRSGRTRPNVCACLPIAWRVTCADVAWIFAVGRSKEEEEWLSRAFDEQPYGSAEAGVVVASAWPRPFLVRASAWLTVNERADLVRVARDREPRPARARATVAARLARLAENDAVDLAEYDSEKLSGELASPLLAQHAATESRGRHPHVPRLLVGAARRFPGSLRISP